MVKSKLVKDLTFSMVLLLGLMNIDVLAGDIFSKKVSSQSQEYWQDAYSYDHWLLDRINQKASLKRRAETFLKTKDISKDNLDYLLGTENSLKKIFKDKYWFKGKISDEISIQAAKNEYESFQLCIIPVKNDKAIEDIQLEVSDLNGPKGRRISKDNIRCYEVGYVKTTKSANPTDFVGWRPDPLLETKVFMVKPEEIRPIWVELYVPPQVLSGKYEGVIKVTTANSHPAIFRIHLDVCDFTLPEKQICRTCTWISPRHIKGKYGADREKEMYRKYLSYFLKHKINPINVGKHYYKKENFKTLDENIGFALERGLELFEIPRLKGNELKKLSNHLREKGWFDKAMIYALKDEPDETDYPEIRRDSAEIRKIEPGLKIFLAESPHPGLYGAIDIWWSCIATENRKYVEDRLKSGEDVCWYRCGIPHRCEYNRPYWEYPSDTRLDRPSIDMRIIYWMMWKYGMSPATFFWAGNYWPEEYQSWPSVDWNTSIPYNGLNGDSYVVYPGDNGPLPSIRLKCIRDGIEDYEYLYLLKEEFQRAKKRGRIDRKLLQEIKDLLAIENSLIVNTHYYSKNPQILLDYRLRLARMIERFKVKVNIR